MTHLTLGHCAGASHPGAQSVLHPVTFFLPDSSTTVASVPSSSSKRKPTCLHLLSGPADRFDRLAAILRRVEWEAHDVDIVNAPTGGDQFPHAPSSDLLWEHHLFTLLGSLCSVCCGTPCETSSAARHIHPGPRPLRSLEFPYGLPKGNLTPRQ